MNRQRGSILFDALLYGGIAVVALGALAGANSWLKDHYVAPERTKWDREKGTLLTTQRSYETDLNTCSTANASLQGQFDTFLATHNAQVQAQADLDKQQRSARVAREKANEPRLQQNTTELLSLVASLSKPAGGLSCEQMDAALLETAKQRQHDYGSASTPATAGGGIRIAEPPERPTPINPLVRPK